MSTHVLKPRPPLRAFVLTAGLALVGMIVFLIPDVFGALPALRWVGIGVLALALGLLAMALLAMSRNQVQVVLDADGYQVISPNGTNTGRWEEVTRVTRVPGQVILYDRAGGRKAIALPRGGAGDLDALGAEIARRLDTHRGYGSVPLPAPAPGAE